MKLTFLKASAAAVAMLAVTSEANAQDFGRVIEKGAERAVTRGIDTVLGDWRAERNQERRQENREFDQGIRERDREHRYGVTQAGRDADLQRRLELQSAQYGMRSQYDQNRAAIRSDGFTPQYSDDFSRFAGSAPRQALAPYQGGVYQGSVSQAPSHRVLRAGESCTADETPARIIVAGRESSGCVVLNIR